MNKEFYKKSTSIGAILVIIGFILPWYSLGFISFSGYDIPKMIETGNSFSTFGSSIEERSIFDKVFYILYLFPLLSCYLLYCEYSGKHHFKLFSKLSISGLMIGLIGFYLIKSKGSLEIIKFLGYGFLITVGGCSYLLSQAIKQLRSRKEELLTGCTNFHKKLSEFSTKRSEAFIIKSKKSSQWFYLNKKKIIVILSVAIFCFFLYAFLNKSSNDKMISAFEQENFKDVNFYYLETNSKIADGDLKLNPDEKLRFEMVYDLSRNLELVYELKEKIKSDNNNSANTFSEVDKELLNLPELKNSFDQVDKLNVNVQKVKNSYYLFLDTFNVSYAESIINEFSTKEIFDGKVEENSETSELLLNNLILKINRIISRVKNKENKIIKNRIIYVNKMLGSYEKSAEIFSLQRANSILKLSTFSFNEEEGDFDTGYSESRNLFEEKKFIAYQSTLQLNERKLIIYIDNKKSILLHKIQDNLNEENGSEDRGSFYSNSEYSLEIIFLKRLDDSLSEDQGEGMYRIIIKEIGTGKKVVKEVFCYCNFI